MPLFPRAINHSGLLDPRDRLYAYDVDPTMTKNTRCFLRTVAWQSRVLDKDYLEADGREYDFAIMNPPYVRQEWLDKKGEYQKNKLP